jgi:hypothetical protein
MGAVSMMLSTLFDSIKMAYEGMYFALFGT